MEEGCNKSIIQQYTTYQKEILTFHERVSSKGQSDWRPTLRIFMVV